MSVFGAAVGPAEEPNGPSIKGLERQPPPGRPEVADELPSSAGCVFSKIGGC